jgi:renalase
MNDMVKPEQDRKCLIVGAGMAGLMAAQALTRAGLHVQIVEQASHVGGRMATTRFAGGVFDYGAQFFTTRDSRFRTFVEQWQRESKAELWAYRFESSIGSPHNCGHPRFRGRPDMATIPQSLAAGLNVQVNSQIVSSGVVDGRWTLVSKSGIKYVGDALILTPPVPLALKTLDADSYILPTEVDRTLRSVQYQPCIALMLSMSEESAIPEPGALQIESERIRWLADNQQKGISPLRVAVTIHATPAFSRTYWNAPDSEVTALLYEEVANYLHGAVLGQKVYRWKYSQPVDLDRKSIFTVAGPPPVVFAGDAFAGGRVEGAAISGLDAAEWLISHWTTG